MKKFLGLLMVLAGLCLTGCGLVNKSYDQRERRYQNITNLQARMIVDDFDTFWLADRPTYLTYWYVREAD